MARNTLKRHCQLVEENGWNLSDGAMGAIRGAKLAPLEARGGWLHEYEEGKKVSTTWWAKPKATDIASDDYLQRVVDAFENIPAAVPVAIPAAVDADLCNVFPLFDVHWGMHAWGMETGGADYDLKIAEADMKRSFETVLRRAPAAAAAVLIIGGDFYHTNDGREVTPANQHNLDADGRYQKIIDTSINVMAYVVERIAARHGSALIKVLRGNHDVESHHVLRVGLGQRYRQCDCITVDDGPRDLFMHQWGKTSLFAHHGDKMKPEQLVLKLADVCPFWTQAPARYAYTGHKHRHASERIGGVVWEQLEPFCPADAYGASFVNRRALRVDTYDINNGRVGSSYDPIGGVA
jgi:hypothetical protein